MDSSATLSRKAFIAVGGFLLGYAIDEVWARLVRGSRLQREEYPKFVVGGYRVHHNVFGYLSILVGVVVFPALLIPLGLGMIVGHRRRDRLFWFLEQAE
ncbi:MAG: hypothetical protein OEO79_17100 [Gemmatimonadota bacterium]|nr:hypothetical protein [Gemmatimonadota bacterium]MDH3423837.1 hypothetical protein [Gemmatimonadota bacterium]